MLKKTLGVAAIAAALAIPAAAQDISADPNSGTVNLEAGFTPDPATVDVISGGTINAGEAIDPTCAGYISDAPDVRLNFQASDFAAALPLYIFAESAGDTTLVINMPDGRWICNDDGSAGVNPGIVFGPALSGQYDIWIGSYDEGEYHEARLNISELRGE